MYWLHKNKKEQHRDVKKFVKFVLKILVSLRLPSHIWRRIGPLIIILVPEVSKHSNKHPQLHTLFFLSCDGTKKDGENYKYRQDATCIDDSCHSECLTRSSAVWLVQFSLLVNCCHVRRRPWLILYQTICCSILLCNVIKSSMEAVADLTWVQSTIATIPSMYWYVCSGQLQ